MFQYELPCKPACFEPPTPSQTIKIPTKKPTPRQTRVPSRAPFRVPTQAPTVSPTKVQSAMPTTVPSHRPIPLPSAKPTPKPSTLSTLHPSIRPTISPTTVSATLCVDLDAIEVSRVGPYLPSSVPIKVVSKNGATVEFEVYQYWKETSLSWMAVEYKDAAGRMVCPKSQNTVAAGLMGSFEAKCDSSGYANVTVSSNVFDRITYHFGLTTRNELENSCTCTMEVGTFLRHIQPPSIASPLKTLERSKCSTSSCHAGPRAFFQSQLQLIAFHKPNLLLSMVSRSSTLSRSESYHNRQHR